jgi:hypothetical protein
VSVATSDVQPFARPIVEEVACISTGADFGQYVALCDVDRHERGRPTVSRKKSAACVIESHRKIACGKPRSPPPNDLSRGRINGSHLIGHREIRFGTPRDGGQLYIPDLLPCSGVEDGEITAAIAHDHPPRLVHTDIVAVVPKLNTSRRS